MCRPPHALRSPRLPRRRSPHTPAALKRVLAQAFEQHGLTFQLGFELEFYLLRRPDPEKAAERVAADTGPYAAAAGPPPLPPPIDASNYCSSTAFDAAAPGRRRWGGWWGCHHGVAAAGTRQRHGGKGA